MNRAKAMKLFLLPLLIMEIATDIESITTPHPILGSSRCFIGAKVTVEGFWLSHFEHICVFNPTVLKGFLEPTFHLCKPVVLAGGKFLVCWESVLKDFFRSLELFFFGCISKASILTSPKAYAGEPNSNGLKQAGEIFAFHLLLHQLFKLGEVMILKELFNVPCSGGVYL